MVLLIAEGPSYTFHALGWSKPDVNRVFRLAWKRHVQQTGADPNYRNAVTINYIKMKPLTVYRDYEPI